MSERCWRLGLTTRAVAEIASGPIGAIYAGID